MFDIRDRHLGFLPHRVRCLLPDLGPIIGYAVTSQTRADKPTSTAPDMTADYLRYVAAQPGPKVAVGQDLDDPPGLGAQFGEVNATIHKKLGCVGHITDGCPRDLDEVHALGFQLFGLNPCVSHAYVRRADPRRPPRRLRHPHRHRPRARRSLPRGRAARTSAPGPLPLGVVRPRRVRPAAFGDEGQDPGVKRERGLQPRRV